MIIKKYFLILIIFVLLLMPFSVLLAVELEPVGSLKDNCPNGQTCLKNPLGVENVQDLIGQVINAILGVVGSLALLMFVYGGLTWMTAAGNEEKIKKGKGILMWATIGLVVIFTSYAVLRFIISVLQGS